MNAQFDEMGEVIREHLARSSSDVPDTAAMRERVLTALEMQSTASQTASTSIRKRSRRTGGLVVGLAGAVAAVGIVLAQQAPNTLVVTDGPASDGAEGDAADEAGGTVDLAVVRQAMASVRTTEEGSTWAIRSAADRVLTLELVPDEAEPERSSDYLRIVTLTSPATADDVVASITTTLFDTTVTGDAAGRIGGLESRSLRLETVSGTTRLGFKVADDTYIETEGINRVFVVHITRSPLETTVYWIESSPDQIDALEAAASRFVEALNEG